MYPSVETRPGSSQAIKFNLFARIVNVFRWTLLTVRTPLPDLMTPFPKKPPINEEVTVAVNEAATGANKVARNPASCFFISCFTVSVTPSINTP